MGSEGTYGTAALLFGAADFEIGKARYAGVFLEFCVGVDEHGKRWILWVWLFTGFERYGRLFNFWRVWGFRRV